MEPIKHFLNKDLSKLSLEEKTNLFVLLLPPINFAIKKVMSKFHSLPLEHSDLLSYAWIAFDNLLKVYQVKKIRKKFVWSVIDAVSWKCTDVCTKYMNNRHKVLNMSVSTSSIKREIIENIKDENYQNNGMPLQEIVDTYFENSNEKLAKQVFEMYLNNCSNKEICKKLDLSRNKFKKILKTTIDDLRNIIRPLLD
ncbi:sigma-70 family RNA polymerase sigma factor [Mycoplasma capricolum]|uniref:sigma-70 family RNA polymerase sigma factor n=1 Tax=Mycoplasma capricolum TaxID=2095 RepID=UPI0020BF9F07|nr:sigma-70 family RNA polymerase sigma factor [Mycoplasma capricolum]MCK8461429.1 sigma-70 family RNA polymerase sigma factor [Mycoplasma capricolum subsp. capricolum]